MGVSKHPKTRLGQRNWNTKDELYYIQEISLQQSQIGTNQKRGLGQVRIESGLNQGESRQHPNPCCGTRVLQILQKVRVELRARE